MLNRERYPLFQIISDDVIDENIKEQYKKEVDII